MHAMVLKVVGKPLEWTELPDQQPGPGEIRVKVSACGVCRTDLHVVDGELANPKVPIIPGHEIVGRIEALGSGGVSSEPPAHAAPRRLAKDCVAMSPGRVNANTDRPCHLATCATMWPAAPNP